LHEGQKVPKPTFARKAASNLQGCRALYIGDHASPFARKRTATMTGEIIADVFILVSVAVLWSGFDKRFVAAFCAMLIPVATIAIIAILAPPP
jgi:hypothetical protein